MLGSSLICFVPIYEQPKYCAGKFLAAESHDDLSLSNAETSYICLMLDSSIITIDQKNGKLSQPF